MKKTNQLAPCVASFFGTLAALLLTASHSQAVSGSWVTTTGTGLNWSDGANWSTNPAVPGTAAGDIVNIRADIAAAMAIRIDTTPRTVGILNIGDASHAFTLSALSGGYLTLDNNGVASQINFQAGASTISAPLRLTTGGLIVAGATGTGGTLSGAITTTTAGSKLVTLSHAGSSLMSVTGAISDGSGQIAVLVAGTGIHSLSGANTFTGGLTFSTGTLRVGANSASLGNGIVTLGNAGSGSSVITLNAKGVTGVWGNNIVVSSLSTAASGNVRISASTNAGVAANARYTGTVDLQRELELQIGSGPAQLAMNGDISGDGALVVRNAGGVDGASITLSGNNTFTGGITLGTGANLKLNINSAGALGAGTFTIGGATALTGLSIDNTSGAAISVNTANTINWNNNFTFTGTNNLNFGSGPVIMNANRSVTVAAGALTFEGAISDSDLARNLSKDGAGTLILDGANTYGGSTEINGGSLQGSGSVVGDVFIASGATISGGNGIGTFTIGGGLFLDANAAISFELNSTSGLADQLVANGLTLDSASVFTLSDLGNSSLLGGTTFVVINNTSGFGIDGFFSGLVEGSIISGGLNQYQVSYTGGDGNDFTLAVVAVPEPGTIGLIMFSFGVGAILLTKTRRLS